MGNSESPLSILRSHTKNKEKDSNWCCVNHVFSLWVILPPRVCKNYFLWVWTNRRYYSGFWCSRTQLYTKNRICQCSLFSLNFLVYQSHWKDWPWAEGWDTTCVPDQCHRPMGTWWLTGGRSFHTSLDLTVMLWEVAQPLLTHELLSTVSGCCLGWGLSVGGIEVKCK